MELEKLKEEMDYKMRAWPWGKELAYIDARQAQDKLDDVVWMENWKVEYKEIKWELFAGVSIKIWSEWITKWDWGVESKIEKEKGLISDSFKRACVCWGIGRFLYSLWAKAKKTNTWSAPKGKFELMDYINRIKEETDENHLAVIYKKFMAEWPSQKQIDWVTKECTKRKQYLLK